MKLRELVLPLAHLAGRVRAGAWRGVRFLCYHSVVDEIDVDRLSAITPTMAREGFVRNLRVIRQQGYRLVSMSQALALLDTNDARSGQFVCLTFDDGRLDNATIVWPILRELGISAHFFVSSGLVGARGVRQGVDERYLDADQLRAIVREGGSVGSHGRVHVELPTLDDASLDRELVDSRRELEEILAAPITTHAYPYAIHDPRIRRAARRAGYQCAFTVNTGCAARSDDRYALVRNAMRGGVDNAENYAIIRGGYDFTRRYSELKMQRRHG